MRKTLATALALTTALGAAGCGEEQFNKYIYSGATMSSLSFQVRNSSRSIDYIKRGDTLYEVLGFLEDTDERGIAYSTPIPKELQDQIAEEINNANGTIGIKCNFPVGKNYSN